MGLPGLRAFPDLCLRRRGKIRLRFEKVPGSGVDLIADKGIGLLAGWA